VKKISFLFKLVKHKHTTISLFSNRKKSIISISVAAFSYRNTPISSANVSAPAA